MAGVCNEQEGKVMGMGAEAIGNGMLAKVAVVVTGMVAGVNCTHM